MNRTIRGIVVMGVLSLGAHAFADAVDFNKQIRPVFEANCYKCHAGEKHKGGLKLDSAEAILKGGKDDPTVTPGDAAKSDLLARIVAAKDSDERMPPKGDMLPKETADLIKQWVVEGAKFGDWKVESPDVVAKATGGPDEAAAPKEPELPQVQPADPAALALVQQTGALAVKVAQDTNLVDLEFQLGGDKITDTQLATLAPISQDILWMNLAGTKVTDAGLAQLEPLKNLRKLHLEKTAITDAGLAHLKPLTSLRYLNLYGTTVTDAGIAQLSELKNLKELYVWQTKVSAEGATNLSKAIPGLMINRGWEEPAPAAPAALPPRPRLPKPPDPCDPHNFRPSTVELTASCANSSRYPADVSHAVRTTRRPRRRPMSATANLPTLESLVASVDGVAALPDITLKIVAAAEDPRSDAFRMLKIVSHDPALVTRILKLVNSSFYSLPTKVSSLKHAIAFLGINVVRNMAIASSVATMFRGGDLCEGVTSRDLWQHSIAVAVASRQISQLIHAQFTDDAFLVGMLHDLGLLILHQKQPEDVREICQEARATGRPFLDLEREALGFDHQQIGGALAEKWKFPESICAAIRFHHEPRAPPRNTESSSPSPSWPTRPAPTSRRSLST